MTDEQIISIFKHCNESNRDACYSCDAYQDEKCTVQDIGAQMVQVVERKMAESERWHRAAMANAESKNEFAERLKRVISDERFSRYGIEYEIDRIAKEMTEVQR